MPHPRPSLSRTLILLTIFCLLSLVLAKETTRKPRALIGAVALRGHLNPMIGLAHALAEDGFEVTFPIDGRKVSWIPAYEGVNVVPVPLAGELNMDFQERKDISEGNIIKLLSKGTSIFDKFTAFCDHYDFMTANFSKDSFDVIVTSYMATPYVALAHTWDLPVVYINPSLITGSDTSVSYVPAAMSRLPVKMNLLQRQINSILPPAMLLMFSGSVQGSYDKYFASKELAPLDMGTIDDLRRDSLELVYTCFGFEYPRPVPPLMQLVGPIYPKSPFPIEPSLLEWIDQGPNVLYVCFGTVAVISEKSAEILWQAFQMLHADPSTSHIRVLWSINEDQRHLLPSSLKDHASQPDSFIRLEKFVAQLSVLRHPNVLAFFSHTGAGSAQEGLTNAKPILCMPFFGDQPDFCSRVVDSGAGLQLDSSALSLNQTFLDLQSVLLDPKIKENAVRLSKVFKSCGGGEKAASLIREVLDIGTDHLRLPIYKTPLFQQLDLDIFLVRFFGLLLILWITKKILSCAFRCCFCRSRKATTTKTLPASSSSKKDKKPN